MTSQKKVLCPENDPELLALRSRLAGKWLEAALAEDGYALNADKRESLPTIVGVGAKK